MRKLIKQIFFIPLLLVLFGLTVFTIFYVYFVEDLTKKEFKKVNESVLKNEKQILKNNMNSIIDAVNGIRVSSYQTIQKNLNEILNLVYKDYKNNKKNIIRFLKLHQTENMFFYIISRKTVYPNDYYETEMKINGKPFLILVNARGKYLAVEKSLSDGVRIGVAYKLDLIKNMIKKNIVYFIKNIDRKNRTNYIAIGEITNWYAKNGNFGIIVYHPEKNLIGKTLSLNQTDIKGKHYKKEFFNCLKIKDGCFVSYYFKNPKTGRTEKKYSYFVIYRPYNYVFVKGFYYSQITKDIESIQKDIVKDVEELLKVTIILLLVFVFISFILSYLLSKKIIQQTILEYERLKNNYEKSQKELEKRVYYDRLTNLPNRNMLIEDIDSFTSLCLIDIDDFSDLNDVFGFETGDKILILISEKLKQKYKNVYRVGSDEFAIGLYFPVSENDLKQISKINIRYKDIKINFSIGASFIKGKLLETAETALKLAYKDKNVKYKIYDDQIQKSQKERLQKLQQLLTVLENEDIVPFYQCIVNSEQKIIKYESLMRIKYKNSIIPPAEFMELIKEFKLYNHFSRIMIKKVFANMNKFKHIPVSVNLSYMDISNDRTKDLIYKLLDRYKNVNIVFEILETENIEQFDKVSEFIKHVKKKGNKIAIDDFGSGYSNLINILYLKPDYLKIDSSLIQNIDIDMYYEIVRFIVEFAKKFGIKTIAEFVSDKEKFEKLKNMGIDEFQGYYFCKPKPIDELI